MVPLFFVMTDSRERRLVFALRTISPVRDADKGNFCAPVALQGRGGFVDPDFPLKL